MEAPKEQTPPFTALDRAKAIDIAKVDMFIVNSQDVNPKLPVDPKGKAHMKNIQERFMVIRAVNGRKFVFREVHQISALEKTGFQA
jgi:hypothetical protein